MVPAWEEWEGRIFVRKSIEKSSIVFFPFCIWIAPHPIPFTGDGWKAAEPIEHTPRGHSPCTCSFLLIKAGYKGTKCEKENSQLSLLLTISPVAGMFLHYWLCHMISHRTPSPTRIFLELELSIHLQTAWQFKNFWRAIYKFKKFCSGDRRREQSHEIGIFW